MSIVNAQSAEALLRAEFKRAELTAQTVTVREYPDETIVVVEVLDQDFDRAIEVAREFDLALEKLGVSGFATIRKSVGSNASRSSESKGLRGVGRSEADSLANLLTARSRSSEAQPSLEYVKDASNTLSLIATPRNHLIFGRRGAGKTSLMVEAKRSLEKDGHATVWMNVQSHRQSNPNEIFLWIASAIIERLQIALGDRKPKALLDLAFVDEQVRSLLGQQALPANAASRLVPHLQKVMRRFVEITGCRIYIFLDDLHYVRRADQPKLLDLVHAVTRDIDVWIKVACIKHLSRWFEHSPPMGLQTGHDADHVDLDLTLENPSEAKKFLDRVMNVYARHVGLVSARSVFAEEALNRLVLASGAVPRDYLVLAASAIRHARRRLKARYAGVQDVNRAAGDQSKVKIAELEDDAALSMDGGARTIMEALTTIRAFCLEDKRFTFFKIDFRDKEQHPIEYAVVQSLLDVRIIHLVSSSLSDKQEAGRRAEVFMLDLSQFSGQRLKKHIRVLDFVASHIVLKETSSRVPDQRGETPSRLLDLLRRGPVFELKALGAPRVRDLTT